MSQRPDQFVQQNDSFQPQGLNRRRDSKDQGNQESVQQKKQDDQVDIRPAEQKVQAISTRPQMAPIIKKQPSEVEVQPVEQKVQAISTRPQMAPIIKKQPSEVEIKPVEQKVQAISTKPQMAPVIKKQPSEVEIKPVEQKVEAISTKPVIPPTAIQSTAPSKVLKRDSFDQRKEQVAIVERQPSFQEEKVEQEKEETYTDLGFKYDGFDLLCRKEGLFELKMGTKEKINLDKLKFKFDEVNKLQVKQDLGEVATTDESDWNDESENEELEQEKQNVEETPTQQDDTQDYYIVQIKNIELDAQNLKQCETIYLKSQDSLDQFISGNAKDTRKKQQKKYEINNSFKIKVQKAGEEQKYIIEVFNQSKILIGYISATKDSNEISVYKVSHSNEGFKYETSEIGKTFIEGEQFTQKYNMKSQVKIENVRIKLNKEDAKQEERNSARYYLLLEYSFQKQSSYFQKFDGISDHAQYFFQFNQKDTRVLASLIECQMEKNITKKLGQGEFSIKINAKDIPVEIYSQEEQIASILLDVESPYLIYEQENSARKSLSQYKSSDSKFKNSKIMGDSVLESPSNSNQNSIINNTSSILEKKSIMKNISFRDSIKNSPSNILLQNDRKLILAVGPSSTTNKPTKLQPLNVQTPRKEYPMDNIQIVKRNSLSSIQKNTDSTKDLNQVNKASNINNGMVKNQSSILLNKQISVLSPLNDLGLSKVQSKKVIIKQSGDSNKNYNIISGYPEEKIGGGSLFRDNFSQVANNVIKKQRLAINEIHKKKFSSSKKNVNQFKEQEKFDQDKDYDLNKDFFEKSMMKDSRLEQSEISPINRLNSQSLQQSLILSDSQKDNVKENSLMEESKTPSRLFIDLPEEQKSKIKEERKRVIEEQTKLNRQYIYSNPEIF